MVNDADVNEFECRRKTGITRYISTLSHNQDSALHRIEQEILMFGQSHEGVWGDRIIEL